MDVSRSDIIFEFSCRDNDENIIECGVHILTEEFESSSSQSSSYPEVVGSSSYQHKDGAAWVS